ncbi:hypothetical protein BC629DRAFT_66176 [Irpex lacteus]|nr:hypothetical protein BC629DRAFT_66176 [Irpex lacteus]
MLLRDWSRTVHEWARSHTRVNGNHTQRGSHTPISEVLRLIYRTSPPNFCGYTRCLLDRPQGTVPGLAKLYPELPIVSTFASGLKPFTLPRLFDQRSIAGKHLLRMHSGRRCRRILVAPSHASPSVRQWIHQQSRPSKPIESPCIYLDMSLHLPVRFMM